MTDTCQPTTACPCPFVFVREEHSRWRPDQWAFVEANPHLYPPPGQRGGDDIACLRFHHTCDTGGRPPTPHYMDPASWPITCEWTNLTMCSREIIRPVFHPY